MNIDNKKAAWRALGLFLVLMLAISCIFYAIMITQGAMNLLSVTGVMWSPGLAAVLTCLILKRPVASLPWGWGEWKWNWLAYVLPIGYGLAMYLPVWLLSLGGSGFGDPNALAVFASFITTSDSPGAIAAAGGILMTATLGMAASMSRALGEEIGWRGFMVWEMRKIMPFWAVGLLSGLIWSLWHWPGILFTDYNAGEGTPALQMILFTLSVMPMGIIYAWITFRSKSLWPAAILHASHNLFLQRIYTPLTAHGEKTHFYIDEFGILLPIVSLGLAAFFLWKAKKEGL
ncbi:type II CAAX endopeptidase family protein [uncultured Hyphomonas sp.]|uniref:CPBP family intramembrane glutamic endopeptidase n=1 Tax=uncultured Hyphomonas sp. TaxID=225298 RepID=UPI002AAC188E|nr:type II CAAX endopeptidase family protein [uncultured Hyphomonas sp.]